jgi:predicted nucleotidyltransferase
MAVLAPRGSPMFLQERSGWPEKLFTNQIIGYAVGTMGEFDSYIESWRERWRQERRADVTAAQRARTTARRVARLLVRRYGARRVILSGSLARGDFRRGSDIDLAVEGVPGERFFEASAAAARTAGEFEIDVVPIESATRRYREWLAEEGIVLHGQSAP